MRYFIFFIFLFILSIFVSSSIYLIQHEKTHIQNYQTYYEGKTEFKINLFGGYANLTKGQPLYNYSSRDVKFIDNIIEVIGYHSIAIIFSCLIGCFLVSLAIFLNGNNRKR